MAFQGACYCGAIRYEIKGDPINSAICHCRDCRKSSGTPSVAWLMLSDDATTILSGSLSCKEGKGGAERYFCGDCGTGIMYKNANILPELLDIQTATLDDPSAFPPEVNIQTVEQIPWHKQAHKLSSFEGFPPQK